MIYSELKNATKDSMKLETPAKIYFLLKDEGKDITHKALVELCQIRSDLNVNKILSLWKILKRGWRNNGKLLNLGTKQMQELLNKPEIKEMIKKIVNEEIHALCKSNI